MSNSFSEIFRPTDIRQLIGSTQKKAAKDLLDKASSDNIIQEVLFSGPSGVGKTTIARMYISACLGEQYDDPPFNCADKTGVDYIRDGVIGTMPYAPSYGQKYRVYFLDEIHKISPQAQSSLLVAIEPVPSHVLLIASTTEPHTLIPTLRSRFTEFSLGSPTIVEFQELARNICNSKKWAEKKTVDPKLRDEIIGLAGGNVRRFVRYFQQALDGSFTSIQDVEKQQFNLGWEIINNPPDLRKWVSALEGGANYYGEALGLCAFAASIAKNPKSSQTEFNRAMLIIDEFGDGLPQLSNYEAPFIKRINSLYERISKNGNGST